jgi:osmotically-inducible protein OsmY
LRSDSDVQCAVEAELFCHPNLDERHIFVSVKNGVVTLSGCVPDLLQKYGAEAAVKRVAGVSAVTNTIELRRVARRKVTSA